MKKALLLLTLLAIGSYAFYQYYTTTPTYSLLQAGAAASAHDPVAFEKYVDVESIAGELFDDVGKQRELNGLGSSGSLLLQGLGATLKPALAAGARKQVATYISTGSVEEARKAGNELLSLAGLVGGVISDSSQLKGVAYEHPLPGGLAEVGLEVTQPRYDTTLLVKLQLADKGEHWQVRAITNAGELISCVAKLEKRRLLKKIGR